MRFEERELKPYAEPVTPDLLTEGEAYFLLKHGFLQAENSIPKMRRAISTFRIWSRISARNPLRLCHW
jgi:hypothetical protein